MFTASVRLRTLCLVFASTAALLLACSSSTGSGGNNNSPDSGNGGSPPPSSGGSLGVACTCATDPTVFCMSYGTDSGCSDGLTCFGNGGNGAATCTQPCCSGGSCDGGGTQCPSGFTCTDWIESGVDMGNWCEKS